ncbi:MAG: hypothetical protein ACR2FH_10830, partial [Caulobacteraceae bacterium]
MSRLSQLLGGTAHGRLAGLVAIAAAGGLAVGGAAAATAAKSVAGFHAGPKVHSEGTVNLRTLGIAAAKAGPEARSKAAADFRNIPLRTFRSRPALTEAQAAALAPRATAVGRIVNANRASPAAGGGSNFNGLDHTDQRNNADNGNQFSLEPPDQALAVGHGYVLESVNNALQVYDLQGRALLAAPVSMNRFFHLPSEFNRTTLEQGPFLSDPRAHYDYATGRFFVTEWATLNDVNGAPLNVSLQFVAVSQTSDPTAGWFVYSYETTNSQFFGCPCFPDFDQLGMDASGVYITNNLFGLGTNAFVGAILYALPKGAMEAGSLPVVLQTSPIPTDFTIQPTVVPPHGKFASENGGTEYLVENLSDLTRNGVASAVNVWAITGTKSLASGGTSLGLSVATVPTQTVSAILRASEQKPGPRPLGGYGPGGLHEPLPRLNPDDGRFSSTAFYVNGLISAASSTSVLQDNNHLGDGVAFYQFRTARARGGFTVNVENQAIYSAPGNADMIYPAVAINSAGQGGIGVTLVSPDIYPSAASFAVPEFSAPTIVVTGPGAQPD